MPVTFFCPDNVGVDTVPGSGHCSPIGLGLFGLRLVPVGWGPVFRALLVSGGSLGHSSLSRYFCFGYRHGFKISLRVHIFRTPGWHIPLAWSMVHACSALACATFIHPGYGDIWALSHGASRCFYQSTFPIRWLFWYFRKLGHLELVSGPGAISISILLLSLIHI